MRTRTGSSAQAGWRPPGSAAGPAPSAGARAAGEARFIHQALPATGVARSLPAPLRPSPAVRCSRRDRPGRNADWRGRGGRSGAAPGGRRVALGDEGEGEVVQGILRARHQRPGSCARRAPSSRACQYRWKASMASRDRPCSMRLRMGAIPAPKAMKTAGADVVSSRTKRPNGRQGRMSWPGRTWSPKSAAAKALPGRRRTRKRRLRASQGQLAMGSSAAALSSSRSRAR